MTAAAVEIRWRLGIVLVVVALVAGCFNTYVRNRYKDDDQ